MLALNQIHHGTCMELISQLPDSSIDSVITSPPYWQLREENGRFKKGVSYSKSTQFKKGEHWRESKPHWNKDWLYEKYISEKRTIPELAELCQCTKGNISYWITKHGIPYRSISETRKHKHWGLKGEENGMYGVKGERNPNWKGGITAERQAFYSSEEWKLIVPVVFEKYNYKCVECQRGHTSKTPIHIHHIVSFKEKSLRADLGNLILLCKKCHDWVHSRKNINKKYIKKL